MKYIPFLQSLKTLSNKEQIMLFEAGQIRRGRYWWVTRRNMSKSKWRKLYKQMKEFGFKYRGYDESLTSGWFKEIGVVAKEEIDKRYK